MKKTENEQIQFRLALDCVSLCDGLKVGVRYPNSKKFVFPCRPSFYKRCSYCRQNVRNHVHLLGLCLLKCCNVVDSREDSKLSLSGDAGQWTQASDEGRTRGHGVKVACWPSKKWVTWHVRQLGVRKRRIAVPQVYMLIHNRVLSTLRSELARS